MRFQAPFFQAPHYLAFYIQKPSFLQKPYLQKSSLQSPLNALIQPLFMIAFLISLFSTTTLSATSQIQNPAQNPIPNTQNVQDISITHTPGQIELFLTLPSAYPHTPKLSEQKGYKGVILPYLKADSKNQNFKGDFLTQVQIFNIDNNLYILGIGDEKHITLNISKAPNALKISFSKAETAPSELANLLSTPHNAQLPNITIPNTTKISESTTPLPLNESTKAQNEQGLNFKTDLGIDTWRYVAVLFVMAALVLGLWILKRYLMHKKHFSSYIESHPKSQATNDQHIAKSGILDKLFGKKDDFEQEGIHIITQKNLDSKHKIITIQANNHRYLVLIGPSSTTLLDRYPISHETNSKDQSAFDEQFTQLLEQKQKRLSQYLHKAHE